MRPCWKDLGLTEEGAKLADQIIDMLVQAKTLEKTALDTVEDKGFFSLVLREAHFRVFDLPTLTPKGQREYRQRNGLDHRKKKK